MIKIIDTYVSLENIKTITFECLGDGVFYMVIKHFYDDELVKIEVKDYDQFLYHANRIVESLREEKRNGNG